MYSELSTTKVPEKDAFLQTAIFVANKLDKSFFVTLASIMIEGVSRLALNFKY